MVGHGVSGDRKAGTVARLARRSTIADIAGNLLVVAGVWLAYHTARTISYGTAAEAFANAERVITWQAYLGVDIEAALQAATPVGILRGANVYYLVHFPITIAALVVAFVRARRTIYPQLRNALVFTTFPAVAIHALFPLAPPRMHTEFVDTADSFGPDPYSLPGADAANQFAAMPSLHVAWAVVVAVGLWRLNHVRGIRHAAVAHAMLTPIVVVLTANHFIVDIAAGAAIAAASLAIALRLSRISPNRSVQNGPDRGMSGDQSPTSPPPSPPSGLLLPATSERANGAESNDSKPFAQTSA
ncbi:MAG: phosphatase PAP2 family protein [Acidimicrobiia bacterium]|nr:phosphatase PAP2 family protein [Acidimicrobiia bacterium]